MSFTFKKLSIPDVILIEPKSFSDDRGSFHESFKESDFASNGIDIKFVQDNISHSVLDVIRGLHFKKNTKAQAKLVTAVKGEVFDVAVDIRKNSPTFGQHLKFHLNTQDQNMVYVPEGFAHGFLALEDDTTFVYKCTNYYNKESESGIIWNDPELNIDWGCKNPVISEKDGILSTLSSLSKELN